MCIRDRFIVAYKLLITANNGDTIHPTGNYHIDTSGVNRTFRFNYAGIKIIKNQALCNNFSSATFTAESSFGSGNIQNRALGVNAPGYIKKNLDVNNPQDNYYSIVNNTSANGTTNNAGPYQPTANAARVFNGFWDIIGDHTGAANQLTPGVLPNLSYTINDVDYYTTGNMTHDTIWEKRGFIYKTGPTETQFRITIKNNAAGGGGNDWVLDDIKLATCYPNLVHSPKDTASSCAGVPLSLSDTVKSYFNNYTNYCWEKSIDGINWISTGVCSCLLYTSPSPRDGLLSRMP